MEPACGEPLNGNSSTGSHPFSYSLHGSHSLGSPWISCLSLPPINYHMVGWWLVVADEVGGCAAATAWCSWRVRLAASMGQYVTLTLTACRCLTLCRRLASAPLQLICWQGVGFVSVSSATERYLLASIHQAGKHQASPQRGVFAQRCSHTELSSPQRCSHIELAIPDCGSARVTLTSPHRNSEMSTQLGHRVRIARTGTRLDRRAHMARHGSRLTIRDAQERVRDS